MRPSGARGSSLRQAVKVIPADTNRSEYCSPPVELRLSNTHSRSHGDWGVVDSTLLSLLQPAPWLTWTWLPLNSSLRLGAGYPSTAEWGAPAGIGAFQFQAF